MISPPRLSSLAVGVSRACSSVSPSTVCRRKYRCVRRVSRMSARSPVAVPARQCGVGSGGVGLGGVLSVFVMGRLYDALVSVSVRNCRDTREMANTSSRTLRLLSLLQTHRYWPGAELAARLEVSVRTLRRDVDRLRELGYPVEANRGVDGGYQLAAGAAMPPLVLDDEEAVALAVGLQAAAQGGVAGVAEASVRALAKVVPVMPPRLRRRVEALRTATVPASLDRRARRSTRGAHRRRAGLPGRRAAGVRLRRRATGRARSATSSRSGWCRSAGAGTSSPTTCTATTGAASASTGSTTPGATGARFRPRELPADDAAAFVRAGHRARPRIARGRGAGRGAGDGRSASGSAGGCDVEEAGDGRCRLRMNDGLAGLGGAGGRARWGRSSRSWPRRSCGHRCRRGESGSPGLSTDRRRRVRPPSA